MCAHALGQVIQTGVLSHTLSLKQPAISPGPSSAGLERSRVLLTPTAAPSPSCIAGAREQEIQLPLAELARQSPGGWPSDHTLPLRSSGGMRSRAGDAH